MLRSTLPALRLDRPAQRVDHATELDDRAVAGALDDAAAMGGEVDEVGARLRERPLLVGAGEPALADDVGD